MQRHFGISVRGPGALAFFYKPITLLTLDLYVVTRITLFYLLICTQQDLERETIAQFCWSILRASTLAFYCQAFLPVISFFYERKSKMQLKTQTLELAELWSKPSSITCQLSISALHKMGTVIVLQYESSSHRIFIFYQFLLAWCLGYYWHIMRTQSSWGFFPYH